MSRLLRLSMLESGIEVLKLLGAHLVSFGAMWLASLVELFLRVRAGNLDADSAGMRSAADVVESSTMFLNALFGLAPMTSFGFLLATVVARGLVAWEVDMSGVRFASAALCVCVTTATVFYLVAGFYLPVTLAGLLAGVIASACFGAVVLPRYALI